MISIVVPCYNEEEVILMFYTELKKVIDKIITNNNLYEIIFIDDGSKDNTLKILKEIREKDKNIKIISFSRNFGKEAAIYAGLNSSVGDYVILMDADLQHPPETIIEMIKEAKNGYDMVATRRLNRDGEPIVKSLFSRLFYKIMQHFIPVEQGVQDFRIMTREVVNSIISMKEYNRFSKGIFTWIGFNIKYIEIENVKRPVGKTKWSFRKLFNYAIEGIVSFTTAPLRLSTGIGMIISLVSMISAFIIIGQTIIMGKDVPGYASTITAVLFIGGIQLLTIGILSEYVSKIYLEIKDRPKYIIKNIENKKEEENERNI